MIGLALFFNIQIEVVVILKSGKVEMPINTYGPDGDYDPLQTEKPKIPLLNSNDRFGLIIKNKQTKPHSKIVDEIKEMSGDKLKCKFCEKTVSTNPELEYHIEETHPKEIIKELKIENIKLKELNVQKNLAPPTMPQNYQRTQFTVETCTNIQIQQTNESRPKTTNYKTKFQILRYLELWQMSKYFH